MKKSNEEKQAVKTARREAKTAKALARKNRSEEEVKLRRLAVRRGVIDLIKLIVGSFCVAVSVAVFLDPLGIVNGGVTGIGIVLKELSNRFFGISLPLSVTNLALNLPILIFGLIVKGRRFMGKTIIATLFLSLFLALTEGVELPLPKDDYFLMSGLAAVICGFGVGLVVSAQATTGGTDLLAAILQTRRQHLTVMNLLFVVDGLVILTGLYVFGIRNSCYALFTVYLTSKVGDWVVEGVRVSKAVYIISEEGGRIAERIMNEMERGVTGLSSRGMYSGSDRLMLFCVVSSKEVVAVKRLAYEEDPNAFVIVSDVKEVLGEGFAPYEQNP